MNRLGRASARRRRGVAILYSVFGAFVAGSMVLVMLTVASVSSSRAEVARNSVRADYLAEGAIEAAKKVVQESIANWKEPPEEGTAEIGGVVVPYTIEATGEEAVATDAAGIQTIVQGFEIRATAEVEDAQSTAYRLINAESTPVFQFAVFYTEDLEILPGPSMELGGRVHTNGDMYLGCGNTLTMDTNYVRAVGGIYRQRKDRDDSEGSVDIRKWVVNPFSSLEPEEFVRMNSRSQMNGLGISTDSGYDSAFTDGYDADGDGLFTGPDDWLPFGPGALDFWSEPDGYDSGSGHTVLTGQHGIQEAVSPGTGSIKMFEEAEYGDYVFNERSGKFQGVQPGTGTHDKGYYHENADLSIIVDGDGRTFTAYDGDGNDVTLYVSRAVTIDEVYDARQGGDVRVARVDLEELGSSGVFPENGLLYAGHYGMGTGTDAKGLLLENGSELASKLTSVTQGSAYVLGDYNVVNKDGSAVIADAVNLFSNAWDGSKSSGSSLPDAQDTTYNVAIITGNHETVGSAYNGGLENLPRFHERWSGKDCVINGSFVNTWQSEHATGTWKYGGSRYTAPGRVWSYDTMFNRVANLPPFTPMVVTAVDVVSW